MILVIEQKVDGIRRTYYMVERIIEITDQIIIKFSDGKMDTTEIKRNIEIKKLIF